MNLKTLLIGLSLIAFGTASAYAAGDDKSADKDKAAATSSTKKDTKKDAKAASSDEKAAAGATAKTDEKDDKDAKKPAK